MTRVERVAGAFLAFREAGESALAADRIDAVVATCEHLVGIALVPYVKDDAVLGTIEDAMKQDGQLDDAEVGGKMAAVHRYDIDELFADLLAQRGDLIVRQRLDVGGRMDFG